MDRGSLVPTAFGALEVHVPSSGLSMYSGYSGSILERCGESADHNKILKLLKHGF